MTDTALTERLSRLSNRVSARLQTTAAVSRGALGRRDALTVVLTVTVLYLTGFLYLLTDLTIRPGVGFSVFVVDSPLVRMFESGTGPFMHRPIALLELWVVVWEFSPLNTLLGLGIALLVGLNLGLSYLAITQPRACGMSASAGAFASIPALLAGSACCAPVIFLVLGIQASGILLAGFQLLLPVSVVLLLVTLLYLAGTIDPTAL